MVTVGASNVHGHEDGDILHPAVFARRWAWDLAAQARVIPPTTNTWAANVRYVRANLHRIPPDTEAEFAEDLRRVRGLFSALVNEHGLAQGEEEEQRRLNARQAREELRARVLETDQPLTREELRVIWPELVGRHWQQLRDRKKADPSPPGLGLYRPSWVAEVAASGDPDLILGRYADEEYVDVYNDSRRVVSFEALAAAER